MCNLSFICSDGFDPTDSLRTKSRNSVTAVYLSILNLLPHHLNKRETYFTTMVMRNRDLKLFGYNKCFKRLTTDLNELIKNGLVVCGRRYPVRIVQYRLDNLERNKVMHSNCP